MNGKTVFISYRRNPIGRAFAGRIFDSLKHHGYDVFLDVENRESGDWQPLLFDEITKRGHFLMVLTPDSLICCDESDDILRFEFDIAMESKRNIVPVNEETNSMDDYKKNCPASMKALFQKQGLELKHHSFQTDIDNLIHNFIPARKAKEPATLAMSDLNLTKEKGIISVLRSLKNMSKPLVENLLTLTIIAAFAHTVYNVSTYDNWDYIMIIPISFTLKIFWETIFLPKDLRVIIQFILVVAFFLSLIVISILYKLKFKGQTYDSSTLIGLLSSTLGSGLGYGISLMTWTLKSKRTT